MNVEEYLRGTYNNVQDLGHGWYCQVGGSDYSAVYVPKNTNGNMAMVSYFPGSGGSNPDANKWKEIIHSDNPPEYIVTISSEYSDRDQMMGRTFNGLTNAGVKITDVVNMVFSASGQTGFDRCEQFLSEHPGVNMTLINNNVLNCDGSRINHPEKYPHLIEAGVPIIYLDGFNDEKAYSKTKNGTQNGFNVYWLKSSSNGHILFNRDIIRNRFTDYILGLADSFGNETDRGTINYELVAFNKELGQFVNADYLDLMSDSVSKVGVPNLAKLTAVDPFDVKEQSRLTNDMGILGNLDTLRLTSSTGRVSNNYYYVQTAMNDIRGMVKSSNYLSSLKEGCFRGGGGGIPGCITTYINAFFDIVSSLLSSLSIEAESVLSYTQAMVDMDNDIAAGVSEIGTVQEIEFGDDYKPQSSYVPQENPYDGQDKNKIKDDGNKKDPTYHPTGPAGPSTPEPKEYTYVFDDGHTAIFKTDSSGKVTEFKYRYECKSAEAAKERYKDIEKTYRGVDYVEKIEVVDKNIDVIFKEEALKDLTFDQIKEKYLEGAKEKNG
jgi:hypothetical protein